MTTERQNGRATLTRDPRAALEALFAPRPAGPLAAAGQRVADARDKRARILTVREETAANDAQEPRARELQKRLRHLRAAEGSYAVTRVTKLLLAAGFSLPTDQEVQLKLLEHADEARVRDALGVLTTLLECEPPQRRTVLEARLRRLEENAEDGRTRELASTLRRRLAALRA